MRAAYIEQTRRWGDGRRVIHAYMRQRVEKAIRRDDKKEKKKRKVKDGGWRAGASEPKCWCGSSC